MLEFIRAYRNKWAFFIILHAWISSSLISFSAAAPVHQSVSGLRSITSRTNPRSLSNNHDDGSNIWNFFLLCVLLNKAFCLNYDWTHGKSKELSVKSKITSENGCASMLLETSFESDIASVSVSSAISLLRSMTNVAIFGNNIFQKSNCDWPLIKTVEAKKFPIHHENSSSGIVCLDRYSAVHYSCSVWKWSARLSERIGMAKCGSTTTVSPMIIISLNKICF